MKFKNSEMMSIRIKRKTNNTVDLYLPDNVEITLVGPDRDGNGGGVSIFFNNWDQQEAGISSEHFNTIVTEWLALLQDDR